MHLLFRITVVQRGRAEFLATGKERIAEGVVLTYHQSGALAGGATKHRILTVVNPGDFTLPNPFR